MGRTSRRRELATEGPLLSESLSLCLSAERDARSEDVMPRSESGEREDDASNQRMTCQPLHLHDGERIRSGYLVASMFVKVETCLVCGRIDLLVSLFLCVNKVHVSQP